MQIWCWKFPTYCRLQCFSLRNILFNNNLFILLNKSEFIEQLYYLGNIFMKYKHDGIFLVVKPEHLRCCNRYKWFSNRFTINVPIWHKFPITWTRTYDIVAWRANSLLTKKKFIKINKKLKIQLIYTHFGRTEAVTTAVNADKNSTRKTHLILTSAYNK